MTGRFTPSLGGHGESWRGQLIIYGASLFLATVIGLAWSLSPGVSAPDPIALKVQGPDTIGNSLPIQTQPPGATGTTQTPVTSSSQGSATALTATLPAAVGKTTYITGLDFYLGGATSGTVSNVTVTGIISGTLNFTETVPTNATTVTQGRTILFNPPIPASAVNTAIVVNVPSSGAGNSGQSVAAWGFQQ